jgi:hypothetical protein
MPHPEDVTPSGLSGLDASASPASDLGPVSPELALIDPELAAAARALLPYPAPASVARPRAPAGAARRVEVALEEPVAEAPVAGAPVGAPRRRYRRLLTTGVPALLATLVLALIVIVDWQDRGMPRLLEPTDALPSPTARAPIATSPPAGTTARSATTPPPTTTARSATTPQPTTRATTEPAPETEPAGQTFVWAASPGAAAYEFQLFRGESRIFRTRVAEPRLQLPQEWRDGGRDQSLEPGTYRWYVWPISESTQRRSRVATVQARLVIED